MPRPKKKARDLTTGEAVRKLFPKEVREEVRKAASAKGKKATKKDST
jgi:hypothetical protein